MIDAKHRHEPPQRAATAAIVCVASGAVLSGAAALGWLFDIHVLTTLGLGGTPIWPLTASGYLAVALGFLAAIRDHRRLAAVLWTYALLLTAFITVKGALGFGFSIDRVLFPDQMSRFQTAHLPGRTGSSPLMLLLVLAAGGTIALRERRGSRELASLVASCALGLCAVSTSLMLFAMPGDRFSTIFVSSLANSVISTLIATGFFLWSAEFAWVRALANDQKEWQLTRLVLPAALAMPVIPSIIARNLQWRDLLTPDARALLVVLGNMLIVALLFYWTVSRAARDKAELHELSEALGTTVVAIVAPDGTIKHWSGGCGELYGWTRAEAEGCNKYALLHSRCQQYWSEWPPFRTAADAQELVELRKDGTEIAVHERVHRVETPGRPDVLVLSLSDVTRGSEAIAALRKSEERLAEATAAYELGVFEWEIGTGRIEWSPGTEERLGLEPGAMPNFEAWRSIVTPEDLQTTLDTVARTVAQRADKFNYRYRLRQSNGTLRTVEGSARAFYDTHGNLIRTVGVIIDVTEREEREAALRQREAQLRSVLETVPDAMVVMDEHGTIREFSKAAEQLWGYRADDVIGQPFVMLAPESDRHKYKAALEAYQRNPAGPLRFVGRVAMGTAETAAGKRVPLESRTGMARTDQGTLFTMFFRDISEQLAAEERLSDLNAELAHVSRQSAMSELAADLAHELNQPLSATSNFLAAARMMLEKGEQPERVIELVRMGGEQTLRAGEIIRRLRAFMAKRDVEMQAESVEQTVRDAVELVLVGTGQFDIRVSYELDPDAPLMFADRIQVQQVLVNLLRNATDALRATERHSREIIIGSRNVAGDMIEISLADTGPGLPDSIIDQLYTRFVTTKSQGGLGMGIGLSISRRIVEAHGGTLVAENRPEGGACFRFTIPAIQQEEHA